MSVSAISGSGSTSAEWYARMQQIQQSFAQLSQALQSGNLSAAQTAFSTLQQVMPLANQTQATSHAGQGSQLQTDMNTLAQALKSGNLSAAQKAFAAVQQDMKAGRHHQHRGVPAGTSSNDLVSVLEQSTTAAAAGNLSISV